MRIAMLADIYKPHISGITNYISLNKKFLEKAGHEVFVFAFGDKDYPDSELNIIRSRGLPLVDTGYYISFRYPRNARNLLYTMDLAHVHHPFLSGSLALRYCRPQGIPVVFTSHTRYDLYAHAYLPIIPDIVGETMLQAYMPNFCRSCDMVVAPSNGMREVMQRFGVDTPIEVVPNGVDLEPFTNEPCPKGRAEFGFNKEDVVLIYVGRLGPEKNLPFLLRSFSGAVQAYECLGLLIVGEGPERDNLQDRVKAMGIESKVHFTGLVPYDDLPCYLSSADAFVTASLTEVHPLSVIEAMASGLPVLGIHSPGVSDTVIDGVTGYLSTDELAAFTAKMVRIVTEHNERRAMGKQAQKASAVYAIEKTCAVMLEKYQQLVEVSTFRKSGLRSRLTRLIDQWRS
jgi:1,2-diacylglycerol 3-alpha-glucosyltransferase